MTGLIPPEEMTSASERPLDELNANATDEVGAVRELILRTHADTVPELIEGETIEALIASIGPAREAYARIVAQAGQAKASVPAVPAGGARPAPVDPAYISAAEKIRRGLATGD